jgi:tRNA (cmo5U34)-methyltransferase
METGSTGPAEEYHFDPDTYLDMVLAEVPAYLELQDALAQVSGGINVERILDLGSGTGETAARVRAMHPTAQLVGIDESDEMLAQARGRVPDGDFRVQRLEEPLPEGAYDLVVSALAVHHLDGTGKADLFRRIAERLSPGGRFVLADVIVPDKPEDVVTPIDGTYDKPSRTEEQLQWLRDAGLRPEVRWARKDLVVVVADRP